MTDDFYSRTEMLIQPEGMNLLMNANVLVVGLGGVGGYTAEQLCRAGVGRLTLVDGDKVSASNINRQIIALNSTIGQPKVELLAQRFHDINPKCQVDAHVEFLRDEAMLHLLQSQPYDCVVDAIDTLSPKVFLLFHCSQLKLPVVSSMGSAGKLDPSQVKIADIGQSHTCPLAAMVRKRLHRMGVTDGIRVVFSTEKVPDYARIEELSQNKRTTIGTISYMPPLFGCFLAAEAIRLILHSNAKTMTSHSIETFNNTTSVS